MLKQVLRSNHKNHSVKFVKFVVTFLFSKTGIPRIYEFVLKLKMLKPGMLNGLGSH